MAGQNDIADAPAQPRPRPRTRKSVSNTTSTESSTGKENMTFDIGALFDANKNKNSADTSSKRMRSKSIGPGGLSALHEAAGNRRKSTTGIIVRSILKPTASLSTLPEGVTISGKKTTSPKKGAQKGGRDALGEASVSGSISGDISSRSAPDITLDLFDSVKISVKSEEEQQAAVKAREEKDRREARRKSLANRRVSFAPEATLHTWDVVEVYQDSTTSSASTNSTRRASSLTAGSPHSVSRSPLVSSDPFELLSTPKDQPEETGADFSPAQQRDLRKKKRRRSAIPPLDFNNPNGDEAFSSSPYSGSSVAASDDGENENILIAGKSALNSRDDTDEESILMSADEEVANHSVTSSHSSSSTSSSGRLEASLNQAAQHAGTRGIEYDEHGDISMDMVDEDITGSFKPWSQRTSQMMEAGDKLPVTQDSTQNINPPTHTDQTELTAHLQTGNDESNDPDEEMTMDITPAVGFILQDANKLTPAAKGRRKSVSSKKRRSSIARRRSSGGDSTLSDVTMDLTMAIGGIKDSVNTAMEEEVTEDISMELTTAIGNVLRPGLVAVADLHTKNKDQLDIASEKVVELNEDIESAEGDADMDVTLAIGNILPSARVVQQTDDTTVGMDFTTAIGAIIPKKFVQEDATQDPATLQPDFKANFTPNPKRKSLELSEDMTMGMDLTTAVGGILSKSMSPEKKSQTKVLTQLEINAQLTPKKKVKGRKSLHVGAARGLLGKRPAELDDDESEGQPGSIKRMKLRSESPVKNVLLPPPPSKAETTGRVARTEGESLSEILFNPKTIANNIGALGGSPKIASTPKRNGSSKFEEAPLSTQKSGTSSAQIAAERAIQLPEDVEAENIDDRIHLQDFLNLTSIRFIELTTTKRRHTVAPNVVKDEFDGNSNEPLVLTDDRRTLEGCVLAGACTLPMLELYQHSCRELKKYISEGRRIVREIETDTFEENPPLFREYINAAPDVKFFMDNQFKNVKTHARLHSKAMWYEWRMKLLEGLREGLTKISDGMSKDDMSISLLEDVLKSTLPTVVEKHSLLKDQSNDLQRQADELANCDQEDLAETRSKLGIVESEIEQKKKLVAEMQSQLHAKEENIEAVCERKKECLDEIKEAERIREECRGWSGNEVGVLQRRVSDLEQQYGWTIISAIGSKMKMTYRKALELSFDSTCFRTKDQAADDSNNGDIDIKFIDNSQDAVNQSATVSISFFVTAIRSQLRLISQRDFKVKDLLDFISRSWAVCSRLNEEVRLMELQCRTNLILISEKELCVRANLLLAPLESKIVAVFNIIANPPDQVAITSRVDAVYGERLDEAKMSDFMHSRVGAVLEGDRGNWGKAINNLGEKLIARGKK